MWEGLHRNGGVAMTMQAGREGCHHTGNAAHTTGRHTLSHIDPALTVRPR